jgi:peptide/nickel transport system ATP-binding protein/oligopeptide transport system ATP-binding protein
MPLLEVADLAKAFGAVRAVDGVSFSLDAGETLGIVGESGCGKTTIAKLVMRLIEPSAGRVRLDGIDLTALGQRALRPHRPKLQMVFQDAFAALNPRQSVGAAIALPLRVAGWPRVRSRAEATRLALRVGLDAGMLERFPHEFSGGQRQRIVIARALALRPKLLVCDEPVSSLDVSVRAQVINLLGELQRELGLALLFISHDLSLMRRIADRVAVIYLGRIVEIADRASLWAGPRHPYTQALLSAMPLPDPARTRARRRIVLRGDPPSPADPPSGCRFRTRCWMAQDVCETDPALREVAPGHRAACHFA